MSITKHNLLILGVMENGRTYKSIDTLNYPLQKIVSFLMKMLFSFLLAPLRRESMSLLVERKQ